MARLTLAMIVKDEVETLKRCLDSVAHLADEIVIVDTGSTDGTLELVLSRADHMAQIPWDDDFATARNHALDLATGDWILILDADEALQEAGKSALRRAIEEPSALGYQLAVSSDTPDGKKGVAHILRLFRNRPDVRFTGRIHEQVTPAIVEVLAKEPQWRVTRLEEVLIDHTGYHPEVFKSKGKKARNIRILKRELADSPDDHYLNYKLYQAMGDAPEAKEYLLLSANSLLRESNRNLRRHGVAEEVLASAAMTWLRGGVIPKAIQAANRAISCFPPHPLPLWVLGDALSTQGDLEGAKEKLHLAFTTKPRPGSFHVDADVIRLQSGLALSQVLIVNAEVLESFAIVNELREQFPDQPEVIHQRQTLLLILQQPKESLREGLDWFKDHPTDGQCLLLCADAAEMLGLTDRAEEWRARVHGGKG